MSTSARRTRPLRFGLYEQPCIGFSYGSVNMWRHPRDTRRHSMGVQYWLDEARQLEDAGFDFVFLGDVLAVYEAYGGSGAAAVASGAELPAHDPFAIASAMLAATKRLGVVVTASTTYEHPFALARRFSTLDHLSGGRVGWNVVTSYLPRAAANFGMSQALPHDVRYERAEEFVDVALALWEDSWEEHAYVGDPASGVFADAGAVRTIDHPGPHFPVRGPHLSPPSPQRTPALFQATWSERGLRFAARFAEVVFAGSQDAAAMRAGIEQTRGFAAGIGRDPESLSFLGAFTMVTAPTRSEVQAKVDDLQRHHDSNPDALAAAFGDWAGVDLAQFGGTDQVRGSAEHTRSEYEGRAAERTAAQLWRTLRTLGRNDATHFVGTPDEVTDAIVDYAGAAGVDGLVLRPFLFPETASDFQQHIAPRLRERGLFEPADEATLRARFASDRSSRLGAAPRGRRTTTTDRPDHPSSPPSTEHEKARTSHALQNP